MSKNMTSDFAPDVA